jgi:hypothetical protein
MSLDRLSFLIAKLRRNEAMLAAFSAPLARLNDDIRGKNVALVGNARSLSLADHGAEIESADLIVRLNRAPMLAPFTHGTRTDWLAMSIRPDAATLARTAPSRLLWMTPKRKNLSYALARDSRFFLTPPELSGGLPATLGARPSTGIMVMALLAAMPHASLLLYGFDFFASRSLSGGRQAGQVPHDFAAESAWTHSLCLMDPRIRLIRPDGSRPYQIAQQPDIDRADGFPSQVDEACPTDVGQRRLAPADILRV